MLHVPSAEDHVVSTLQLDVLVVHVSVLRGVVATRVFMSVADRCARKVEYFVLEGVEQTERGYSEDSYVEYSRADRLCISLFYH